MIFRLLFMGRHPYAGIPVGKDQYEIEDAIRQFLFAFSPQTWSRGLRSPAHTLTLKSMPEKVARLFERAFLPGSDKPGVRPSGREWAQELSGLFAARKSCQYDSGHKFWNGLTTCPWCQITATGGPNFFISVAIHAGTSGMAADVAIYWGTIQRIVTGTLMHERAEIPQVTGVKAAPMPIPKPQPTRLSAPVIPVQPAPLPPPVLQPPVLPEMPVMQALSPLPSVPMERNERVARVSLLGAIFFALSGWLFFTLNLLPLASGAGWGMLVCLFISLMKWTAASTERKRRKAFEREARESERRRVEEAYALRITEYEIKVKELHEQHLDWTAKAEAGHQRECGKLESDYQSRLGAYSAQCKLYESERARFEMEMAQWNPESKIRMERMESARRGLDDTCYQLQIVLESFQSSVTTAMPKLEAANQRNEKSKSDEIADMRILHNKKREAQMRQFLDTKLIRNSKIPGIGRAKEATLLAYGIESALDINTSISVPGIGGVLLTNLRAWRAICEREFRYNANTPLPPAEVQAVKLKHAQTRQSALIELREGAARLTTMEGETRAAVSSLKLKILELARIYAQAVADHRECV
jgi:DNA-binding helix-hairpin-helix protein with protein kinase domain